MAGKNTGIELSFSENFEKAEIIEWKLRFNLCLGISCIITSSYLPAFPRPKSLFPYHPQFWPLHVLFSRNVLCPSPRFHPPSMNQNSSKSAWRGNRHTIRVAYLQIRNISRAIALQVYHTTLFRPLFVNWRLIDEVTHEPARSSNSEGLNQYLSCTEFWPG